METNFDEGISNKVLKGSFLALKQLQTKGKTAGKLKKSPSSIKEEVGPRSPLYETFKELHGFDSATLEATALDLTVPKSQLMYKTFKGIFDERNKKVRYSDSEKPYHPFFGSNAFLTEEFKRTEISGPSATTQEIIEEMELEGLTRKYNYGILDIDGRECRRPHRSPVVRPLRARNTMKNIEQPQEAITQEFLDSLKEVLVDSLD